MNRLMIMGYGYLGEAIADCFNASEEKWEVIKVGRSSAEGVEQSDISSKESLEELRRKVGKPSHIIHCVHL